MNYYDYHLASNKLHFIQKKLEEEKQKNQEQQRKLEEEEQQRKLEEEEQKNQEQQIKLKEKEQIIQRLQVSLLSKLILTVFNKRFKEKRCSFTLISFIIIIITVGCKKKFPFRPRRTGVARLDRCRFHTVPRAFNFLHRLTSSVARLFNVHEETVRSIAMYVRR